MRSPVLEDFFDEDNIFITVYGSFGFFYEYTEDSSYPVDMHIIKWRVDQKKIYSISFSVTEYGQYYEDESFSGNSIKLLG